MMRTLYRLGILFGIVLLLGVANFTVYQREQLLHRGSAVILELAPVDPRSLMQGDYMALRFEVAAKVQSAPALTQQISDGHLVLKRDASNVGRFVRLWKDGDSLAGDEFRLRFRQRSNEMRIVTNAWFFREGEAARFSSARFGELRVAENGDALLVAMRDKDQKLLGERK